MLDSESRHYNRGQGAGRTAPLDVGDHEIEQ
jgi:hypothetical protein